MADPRDTPPTPPRWKRTSLTVAKWLLFAVVLGFVARALGRQIGAVRWDTLTLRPWPLVAALAAVLVAKALTFVPYGIMVGHFCRRPLWRRLAPVVWVSQTGKYLPGKVGAVLGMAWLLGKEGISARVALSSIFIVDGLSVVVGLLTAIPITLMDEIRPRLPMAWLWCALAVVGLLVCVHPRVFGTVANALLKRAGVEPFDRMPSVLTYVKPVLALLVQYAFLGLGCWLLALAIAPVGIEALPAFLCAMVVATIGGFVVLFAPAGLGVQEGLLLVLLGTVVAPETAAIVVVMMRLAQTLCEAALAGFGFLALRRPVPKDTGAADGTPGR